MTPPWEQSRFVKEILLPGGYATVPFVDARLARFALRSGPSTIDRWGLFAGEEIPPRRVVIDPFSGVLPVVLNRTLPLSL